MDKKILVYVLLGFAILALLVLTFFPEVSNAGYITRDYGNDNTDKCTAPEGTSQENWNEHMSHHPEIYKECLN